MERRLLHTIATATEKDSVIKFKKDVLDGLQSSPKELQPKYFYDDLGTELFREIMKLPEYYLTDCELDIFRHKTQELSKLITQDNDRFDLIELGAGDGFKSRHLLDYLVHNNANFTYIPIDISKSALTYLTESLNAQLPRLNIQGFQGDYMEMLPKACKGTNRRKVVLFLGANIGNMEVSQAGEFCRKLQSILYPKDRLLIGFDLKKDPKKVLAAYNDQSGITSKFNLNLLERINRELDANFLMDQFEHYPVYDPITGACRSYLVSLKQQQVYIGESQVNFQKNEVIQMEISQKYDLNGIRDLAATTGFKTLGMIMDSNEWFVDAIWEKME